MEKQIIADNFSKSAPTYDRYALVQKHVAGELIKRCPGEQPESILEIGCGTGIYTEMLRQKYPDAKIKALDISAEMTETARRKMAGSGNIKFLQADAESYVDSDKYGLITANATFQWLHNLEKSMAVYKEMLEKNGSIVFSTFGPDTYKELNAVLSSAKGKDAQLTSSSFPGKRDIENMLRGIFKDFLAEELMMERKYGSFLDLLNTIRNTGTRGKGTDFLWNRGTISRMEKLYISMFGDIRVTCQVFLCRGKI